MNYLVTGGAGFIGSHIVEKLIKEGHYVRVLDNMSTGKYENLDFITDKDKFDFIFGDICNPEACNRACKDIDYILFQSALKSVPESIKNPKEYNNVNVVGLINMLEASVQNKVKRFIFASSSSVYGNSWCIKSECEALSPISPYALTKLTGEYYCKIFSELYNLETVCLRYFNVFGAKQSLDDEYASVIPKFIDCLLNDAKPPVFGDGKQSRDFIHVDDVVLANIYACNIPDIKYEIFNVATGKKKTILELLEGLNKLMDKNIEPEFLPIRDGDILHSCANIIKIKNQLNFKPGDFIPGLDKTIKYYVR